MRAELIGRRVSTDIAWLAARGGVRDVNLVVAVAGAQEEDVAAVGRPIAVRMLAAARVKRTTFLGCNVSTYMS